MSIFVILPSPQPHFAFLKLCVLWVQVVDTKLEVLLHSRRPLLSTTGAAEAVGGISLFMLSKEGDKESSERVSQAIEAAVGPVQVIETPASAAQIDKLTDVAEGSAPAV